MIKALENYKTRKEMNMTFDVEKTYHKNLEEFKALAEQFEAINAKINETQAVLQQLAQQKQEVYTAAKAAEKVVAELQPYVTTAPEPAPVDNEVKEEVSEQVSTKKAGRK